MSTRSLLVVFLILLAGCSGTTVDDPTTRVRTPTATPGMVATPSASSTTAIEDSTPTQTPTPTGQRTTWTVTVIRVVDGDTFEVEFPDGHTENVRLLGVDTAEVHTENDPTKFESIPDTKTGRDWLRDWGHKASEFARMRLGGEQLTIRTDPQADRRGSFGRLLVYVIHDGEDFNLELIEQGYARMYDSQFSRRSQYASAEQTAQSNGVGLWGFEAVATATPTPITDGGGEGPLTVVEIHADAEGNDHENKNDEYVVFENTGEAALDLSGWSVADEADHTYGFPSGFTLAPGERVTLYTGCGTDTESELYWGSDRAIWNNGGDTIIVTDENGQRVLVKEYS